MEKDARVLGKVLVDTKVRLAAWEWLQHCQGGWVGAGNSPESSKKVEVLLKKGVSPFPKSVGA